MSSCRRKRRFGNEVRGEKFFKGSGERGARAAFGDWANFGKARGAEFAEFWGWSVKFVFWSNFLMRFGVSEEIMRLPRNHARIWRISGAREPRCRYHGSPEATQASLGELRPAGRAVRLE